MEHTATIDTAEGITADPITDVATIPASDALSFFTDPSRPYLVVLKQIDQIVANFETDITTPKGRKTIKSLAHSIARAKARLDDAGKAEKERQGVIVKKIDESRRNIKSHLEALQENVRAPLDKWEAADQARKDRHLANIATLNEMGRLSGAEDVAVITRRIDAVDGVTIDGTCEEFEEEYRIAKENAATLLAAALEMRRKYEAEQAELAELRTMRENLEAEKRAADEARRVKEKKAQDEALKAEREAAQAEIKKQQEALRAAQEKAAQQAMELAALRAKEAAEAAARADEERLAKDRKHRADVHGGIVAALVDLGASEQLAKAFVTLVAKGKIQHLTITY